MFYIFYQINNGKENQKEENSILTDTTNIMNI